MSLNTIQAVVSKFTAGSRLDRMFWGASLATTAALSEVLLTAATGPVTQSLLDLVSADVARNVRLAVGLMLVVGTILIVIDVVLIAFWLGRPAGSSNFQVVCKPAPAESATVSSEAPTVQSPSLVFRVANAA